uniref:Uncharacterized protein n=1 Tax=Anguilla anguilla TaxID=7936 RepID=A0A0E9QAZ1_ANGAN
MSELSVELLLLRKISDKKAGLFIFSSRHFLPDFRFGAQINFIVLDLHR